MLNMFTTSMNMLSKLSNIPRHMVLTAIVKARINMMIDVRPITDIILLTTSCPVKAAITATQYRYTAADNKNH